MNKQREEFEEWAKNKLYLDKYDHCDDYSDEATYAAWGAWQAAQSCCQQAEPVAIEYQHEDTGQIGFIDTQQVGWGFFSIGIPPWNQPE